MKTSVLLLVVLALVAGTQAGKKLKKCNEARKALEKELKDLKAELKDLQDAPAPVCTPAPTEAPTEAPVHAAMLGFWPLNEEYGGKNLATDGVDFELGNVGFDAGNGDFKSAPAKFSTAQDSVAVLDNANAIAVGMSFSWVGAVYRRSGGDGALFEWDNNPGYGTHIWILRNKLYIHMYRNGCSRSAFHTQAAPVQQWLTLAVTYDGQKISFYQNGVRSDVPVRCGSKLDSRSHIRINQRFGDKRRIDGDMTCFGLFNDALSYEELVKSTIDKC